MKRPALALVVTGIVLGLILGCGDDEPTGTGQIRGNVESFENVQVVARLLAAIEGVTVYLDGPVSRSTTTDADGNFVFTDLPAGEYTLSFEYNSEEVTYRGSSGQEATITVEDDQTVEATGITISGGHVNIGNIQVVQLNESDDPVDDGEDEDEDDITDDTGTATNDVPEAPEPPPTPDITTGLVAHYPLNGNANDASGNGYHGTPSGGVAWSGSGVVGGAAQFDGTNDFISAGDVGTYSNATVAFWMNANVVENWRNPFSGQPVWDDTIRFEVYDDGRLVVGAFCMVAWFNTAANPIVAGDWYHVVFTYDDTHMRGYVNGSPRFAETYCTPFVKHFSNLTIGGGYSLSTPARLWQGAIDEVRLYSRALTDAQVQYLHNSQK